MATPIDERKSRLLAAWHTFRDKIANIRTRQRRLLSDFEHSLTEREIETLREHIKKS